MSRPKIVIIGAGSLTFSRRLTIDLLLQPTCKQAHFALVDIDEQRLEFAGRIADRILKEGGFGEASFSLHTRHREALSGADYIITSILVGGYPAIESEIDIPKKYGVDQAIGDTLTPGGIMRCLRTLPVLVDVARDMRELCPGATLLNYTNPMSMLCWGIYEQVPEVPLVGLCHSVQGTSKEWAERVGVSIDECNFECYGINHQAWFIKFEHNGKDMLPAIREAALVPETWAGDTTRCEYVKHLGYAVTESAGHNSEYTPWWRKKPEYIERYCPGGRWNGGSGFIKELHDKPDWAAEMEKQADGGEPIDFTLTEEYGSFIVNALEGGDPVVIHGNVRNEGQITNLPLDSCVEGPIYCDKNGMRPIHCGSIPHHLAAINQSQINVQRLAKEAALQVDPELVFQAMELDPLTASVLTLDDIRAMTRELLETHKPYLGEEWQGKEVASKPIFWDKEIKNARRHIDPGMGEDS